MDIDGYYDHHPTVALHRPVALTGFFGTPMGAAGVLSQHTGVPVVELDRWIEHEHGCSLSELVYRKGVAALRETEEALFERALLRAPAPLIVLGDGALLSEQTQQRALRETLLVYLRAPLEELWPRIEVDLERARAKMYPFVYSVPKSVDDIRPIFEERERGYLRAHHTIDVAGRSAAALADELRALVDAAARESAS